MSKLKTLNFRDLSIIPAGILLAFMATGWNPLLNVLVFLVGVMIFVYAVVDGVILSVLTSEIKLKKEQAVVQPKLDLILAYVFDCALIYTLMTNGFNRLAYVYAAIILLSTILGRVMVWKVKNS